MHAFEVPDGNGKLRKAFLLAMIDDATRRILHADFAFIETSLRFEYGTKHVLMSHGKIERLFVDNWSAFVSGETSDGKVIIIHMIKKAEINKNRQFLSYF